MIKRIDLFMPPRSQYGVLHHFTEALADALTSAGVSARILQADYHNPAPFLEAIANDPPDCTLSFNGLLPDEKGNFFCELIGIPHVACIVDSQNLFISLINSPLTIVACSDRDSADFFNGLKCKNVLFMPHGVEEKLCVEEDNQERIYPVTVLCSLIDYNQIRSEWKNKYDKVICLAMDEAIEATFADSTTSYVQALVQAVDRQMELNYHIDPAKIDFVSVMDDIEMYIKGKSRIDAIKAIKDAKVHIFGSASSSAKWEDYIDKDQKNVIIHEPIPYEQVIEVLKTTQILLNSSPWIKQGAHERIFYGLACGALVVTNKNLFLEETFEDGTSIVMYDTNNPNEINQKINQYLSENKKREEIVARGREIVKQYHTWEYRARQLVEQLDPIVQNLKESIAQKNNPENSSS